MIETILHILSEQEAAQAKAAGVYRPASLFAQGFIHCSYAPQVCRVADFLYKGRADLVLLEIAKADVQSELRDEAAQAGGERFPHLYGALPWSAVRAVHPFPCSEAGTFTLPLSVSKRSRR